MTLREVRAAGNSGRFWSAASPLPLFLRRLLAHNLPFDVIRGELTGGHFEAPAEARGEILAGIEPVAKSNICD